MVKAGVVQMTWIGVQQITVFRARPSMSRTFLWFKVTFASRKRLSKLVQGWQVIMEDSSITWVNRPDAEEIAWNYEIEEQS